MIDFGAIDYCPACGRSFWGERVTNPEMQKYYDQAHARRLASGTRVGRSDVIPKYLRKWKRVLNRKCPNCGAMMKAMPKGETGDIRQQTNMILGLPIKVESKDPYYDQLEKFK